MAKRGPPAKFTDAEEIQRKLDAYFAACDARTTFYVTKDGEKIEVPDPEPYTITGMCLALDCDRKTLINYTQDETKNPDVFHTIRRAKLKCEQYAERSLWKPKIATGVIFNLTNNYGWKNQQDTRLSNDPDNPLIPSEVKWVVVQQHEPKAITDGS
jgi:hypothetical protein